MNDNATGGKEGGESNDELRARWEGENYRMVVCVNGVVNVENRNYNEAGHIYSVRVEAGHAVGCSCPHATHRGAHCKHQQAVENRPIVVSSATAANSVLRTRGARGDRRRPRGRRMTLRCSCGSPALRITRQVYDGPRAFEAYECETCGARGNLTHDDVGGTTLTGCLGSDRL